MFLKRERYYALLEDWVGPLEGIKHGRANVLLDGVDADRFDANDSAVADPEALSLIRAMSTERVWQDQHQLNNLAKGDWIEISFHDGGDAPMAWEMAANDGYRRGPKRSVHGMRRLGRGFPDGAADGPDPELVARLQAASKAASGRHNSVPLQSLASRFLPDGSSASSPTRMDAIEIIILDVGQASAALIRRNGQPVGLFDAGSPIWFNKGSLGRRFTPPELGNGFIFLSHWDFDHFDLGRRHTMWHGHDWYAPDQMVGPNTALFQRALGARLTFVDGPLTIGGFQFERGTCSDFLDRNNTGYQMRFQHGSEALLLTGDADYAHIADHMKAGLSHLCVPHHGGRGTAPPNPAGPMGHAVVSYGMPNGYHHPHPLQIRAHQTRGWRVVPTASGRAAPRGDRQLYPTP